MWPIGEAFAQTDDFSDKMEKISNKIELITISERAALKAEIDAVNELASKGEITWEEAEKRKKAYSEVRAQNIERRTAVAQQEIKNAIQHKIDQSMDGDVVEEVVIGEEWVADTETNGSNRTRNFIIGFDNSKDSIKAAPKSEARTTSQLVLAYGANYFLADGDFQTDKYADFGKSSSRFFEIGTSWRTRLSQESAIANIKYGLSLQYNQMSPKSKNGMFVSDGSTTSIVESAVKFDKSLLRNVNLVVPVHFELDLTKKYVVDGESYIRSHDGFRMGLGGYVGLNLRSKMKLKFEDELGNTVKQSIKNDYNAENFVYGLSAYIGYGSTSLYAKYDLNNVFENNPIAENNLSIGIRFDFN